MSKHLFISYSRNDADAIDTLVSDASSLGHEIWVDRQLSGGQPWWSELLRHIRECDVFILALSPGALNSQACDREYAYAAALGKPILPVLVREGVSSSLLPPALAGIQWVDYTGFDKGALSALVRGLSSLPDAQALPTPLPAEPDVPATYLFDLKAEIEDTHPLSAEKQQKIVQQLRQRLDEGHEPEALHELLARLRQRDDLLVRTASEIDSLEARLRAERPPTESATSPSWPASQPAAPQMPLPATVPATPAPVLIPQQKQVNSGWWVAPIVFGLIGGLVAWAVNKDTNAATARSMLIGGVVAQVIWWLIFAGGL